MMEQVGIWRDGGDSGKELEARNRRRTQAGDSGTGSGDRQADRGTVGLRHSELPPLLPSPGMGSCVWLVFLVA